MQRIRPEDIKTERELKLALIDLERRWKSAANIKSSRKRAKEILKLRLEVKALLAIFKKQCQSTNFKNNDSDLFSRMLKKIRSWIYSVERKY